MPSSSARMPPRSSFPPPITRRVSSQPFIRRGRPVLFRLPVRPSHSTSLFSSSVPLVASSNFLESPSSAPIELPPVVSLLESETATVCIDSIVSDVGPLPSPLVESSARVNVFDDLPPPPVLYD